MYDPKNIYSWDIETLNDEVRGFNGLDPARSRVTEIVVATDESINGGGEVFADADEARLLRDFATFFTSLAPGLMSGWNDSGFDIPFVRHRASVLGVALPMRFNAQPNLLPKYDPLPTSATDDNPGGIWSATFDANGGHHASLDISQAYRRFADEAGIKWGLKPVATARGIAMFDLPEGFATWDDYRQRLHERSPQERFDYVFSDGRGTRLLTLQLLGLDYTPYGPKVEAA